MDTPCDLVWPSVGGADPPFIFLTPEQPGYRFADRRRRRSSVEPRSRAGNQRGGSPRDVPQVLLYVSPGSMPCARAELVLRGLLRQYASDAFTLRVVDVARNIEAAERDRVLYTPTLICRGSKGDTRVLGDLSNVSVLIEVLHAMGVEPL